MLVYLHQYSEDETKETVREGDEVVDVSTDEYFDTDSLAVDEWERVDYGEQTVLRKPTTYEDVTRVSLPADVEEPSALPGETIQLRIDGETTYVENAEIIEITDETP
ncbi:hypothetical protein SAMN04487948_10571 [Halogranum amylolyticum]|uniref:Uncharacterized protein n=1 Tax=Halogranum amylolyticum TaxID=660520 RepID=A0A1H8SF82_9EURY|nr:hypothetical protein [Halogranum amylolyticum]SEO77689.1 hypothetical protein SAMN04487948_10571 [Halogranum amylolyticum]